MIARKIENPSKSASKSVRIWRLTEYIRSPEAENASEKCIYAGARGFLTGKPRSQTAEMLALSEEAVRSPDTINHYVLSWQTGEQPSPEQVEDAVSLFLVELNLGGHQVIYALHADTDNIHLHLVINRVHPDTLKVVRPGGGFDLEAAHRAVAVIEYRQGWQREENGRYRVMEDGGLCRARPVTDKPRQPAQPKRDMERRTGEKSAERVAIEDGAPIISRASSWQMLHAQLAEVGMRYEKAGSGAVVFVGDVGVKASRVNRGASLLQLQKRLGPYEPSSLPYPVAIRAPQPLKKDVPGWAIYIAGRKAHHAARKAATEELQQRQDAERQHLIRKQKAHRDDVLKGNWKGRGALWNAKQSTVAAEQAGEKAALRERHKAERGRLRQQYRPYPDLSQWQRQHRTGNIVEQRALQTIGLPRIEWDEIEPPVLRDIRSYVPEIHGQQVHYTRIEEVELGASAAFVDKGREIDIYDWRNRDSVLAALQLAAQKWGSFRVTGNDEYMSMCVQLAAEHDFKIGNPELAKAIQQERQRLFLPSALSGKSQLPQKVESDGSEMEL